MRVLIGRHDGPGLVVEVVLVPPRVVTHTRAGVLPGVRRTKEVSDYKRPSNVFKIVQYIGLDK